VSGPPKEEKTVPPPIALVVVDDNPLLRDGLTAMIQSEPGFKVVAAADGHDGLAKVCDAKPDVVLLDLGLADHDSLALTAKVHDAVPAAKVIVMGILPVLADVADYVQAGASGFIMKDASFDEFLATIRAVADGVEVLPEALTNSLFTQIARKAAVEPKTSVVDALRMTAGERRIITLIGDGLTNTEIATELQVDVPAVTSAVHNVMEKLALLGRLDVADLPDLDGQATATVF
jgi:DNA-binding NarL/FixJ family response regulator